MLLLILSKRLHFNNRIRQQNFWYMSTITCSVISSWSNSRIVDFRTEDFVQHLLLHLTNRNRSADISELPLVKKLGCRNLVQHLLLHLTNRNRSADISEFSLVRSWLKRISSNTFFSTWPIGTDQRKYLNYHWLKDLAEEISSSTFFSIWPIGTDQRTYLDYIG